MSYMRSGLYLALLTATLAWSAPNMPRDDREVLERLPVRPSDPLAAELRTLRAAVTAAPADIGYRDFNFGTVCNSTPRAL